MYREMTAEEKLEFSAAIINAIKEGGIEACLKVVKEYEKKLLIRDGIIDIEEESNEIAVTNSEITAPISHDEVTEVSKELPKEASIYAIEHITAVEEDRNQELTNEESFNGLTHPKTRILTNSNIPSSHNDDADRRPVPSPYQDAMVVEPGHFNNSNKML